MKRPFIFSFVIILLSLQYAYAIDELTKVQQAITQKNAGWTAGKSWVSELSIEEFRQLCGGQLVPPDADKFPLIRLQPADTLPAALDWRNNNGNWITPIKDQGNCGSCWAFAAIAHLESWWKIHNENPDSIIDLSEQFAVSCSGAGSCDGGAPFLVLDYCTYGGIPHESCFPYQAADVVCGAACTDWMEQAVTIPHWGWITMDQGIIENMKIAVNKQPVSACFTVYEDFAYYESGIYEHVSGNAVAGHCIQIIGWNDTTKCWICKNSWGANWGETVSFTPHTPGAEDGGYFRIKWDQCNINTYIPFIFEELPSILPLSVSPESLDFSLTVGDSVSQSFSLNNTGNDTIEYFTIPVSGKPMFHITEFAASLDDHNTCWWCGDDQLNGYGNMWLQYLDTPILNLSGTLNPSISSSVFWAVEKPLSSAAAISGWDGCNVWISVNAGRSFEVLQSISPEYNCQNLNAFSNSFFGWDLGSPIPGWTGNSDGWSNMNADLSDYIADSVVIRFAFASDGGICTIDDPTLLGFYVDDIIISDGDNILFEEHGEHADSMYISGMGGMDWIFAFDAGLINPDTPEIIEANIQTRYLNSGFYKGFIDVYHTVSLFTPLKIPVTLNLSLPDHDIACEESWFPIVPYPIYMPATPSAIIKNCGVSDETNLDIVYSIQNNNQIFYSDTAHISGLISGISDTVYFKPLLFEESGVFESVVSCINPPENDYNSYNNLLRQTITSTNLFGGFETDQHYWNYEGGWGITSVLFRHGDYSAHVNAGIIPYLNNMNAAMTLINAFQLQNLQNATISYWTRYTTEENRDILFAEISTDSLTWIKKDSLSGSGSRFWTQRFIDLSDLLLSGYSRFWLRFHFISDSATTSTGVFIEDVEILPGFTGIQPFALESHSPVEWNLSQNFPNPFNPSTEIRYQIPSAGNVSLSIFNILGQKIITLIDENQSPGYYKCTWNASNLPSGIYFYCLEVRSKVNQLLIYRDTKKMVVLK